MRRRELCYTIRDREDGIVLGQFLKAKGFSHRLAARIKAGRGLAVDGMPAHAGYRLKAGRQWRWRCLRRRIPGISCR